MPLEMVSIVSFSGTMQSKSAKFYFCFVFPGLVCVCWEWNLKGAIVSIFYVQGYTLYHDSINQLIHLLGDLVITGDLIINY